MECPSCGEEKEDGSRFCRFCGEDLAVLPDDTDIKQKLQSMDDYEFEHFVADLWETMGWDCEVSTASNDKGIDVRAKKTTPYNQKALIQAKRYGEGNKVGSPAIQQYSSLKHQEDNVDKVVVVTTSSYSRNAKELADDLNVKLIDGDDLIGLVDQEGAEELLLWCIDQAVAEARANNYSAPPKWYYEQLGIIYRKEGRYVDERMLLERYMDICEYLGGEPREELVNRLGCARQLAAQ
ncbi:restriction endonuclease [Natrinema sp. H-ect4]|uniref:restriction endonuclease n=1 Tax=Natrinema sp. H-ect4 TaxID=3242699 RepID=UPI0035A97535